MHRSLLLGIASVLAGCAAQPRVVPIASAPAPAPTASAAAGYGNLVVPPRLADGSFVTPNRNVSAAGAVWHLRAGLNVAALSCRGSQEAALVASYNGLLGSHRSEFDRAYRALASEHGGDANFDRAMTALYNYYALPPAQPGLCAAAGQVLSEAAQVPAGGLAAFAPGALARIDRPYAKVFTEQEAWLAGRTTGGPATLVAPAAAPVALKTAAAKPATPVAKVTKVARAEPRIAIDRAVLLLP